MGRALSSSSRAETTTTRLDCRRCTIDVLHITHRLRRDHDKDVAVVASGVGNELGDLVEQPFSHHGFGDFVKAVEHPRRPPPKFHATREYALQFEGGCVMT